MYNTGAISSLGNMAMAQDMDFHALFNEIDQDGNGYIDKTELRAVKTIYKSGILQFIMRFTGCFLGYIL